MMQESVDQFSCFHVPHSNGGVRWTSDNHFLVVLQTQDTAVVSRQHFRALQGLSIPDFNGVITETTDDLLVVVL